MPPPNFVQIHQDLAEISAIQVGVCAGMSRAERAESAPAATTATPAGAAPAPAPDEEAVTAGVPDVPGTAEPEPAPEAAVTSHILTQSTTRRLICARSLPVAGSARSALDVARRDVLVARRASGFDAIAPIPLSRALAHLDLSHLTRRPVRIRPRAGFAHVFVSRVQF